MIQKISFENYKAFEKGEIELKPITILLGANSVGKSSIIQLLLLMQQTANANKGYNSALKLNGNFVSLGENINIFRGKKDDKPVAFSFDFEDESLYMRLKKTYLENLVSEIVHLYFNTQIDYFYNEQINSKSNKRVADFFNEDNLFNRSEKETNKLIKDAIENRNNFIELLDKILQIKSRRSRSASQESLFYKIVGRNTLLDINNIEKENYLDLYDFLKIFRNIREKKFTIKFEINHHTINPNDKNDNFLYLRKLTLFNNDDIITSFEIKLEEKEVRYSLNCPNIKDGKELIDSKRHKDIEKYIGDYKSTIFSILKKPTRHLENDYFIENDVLSNSRYVFIKKVFELLSYSISIVEGFFIKDQINYVSPLRAYPKRYYFLDKANTNTNYDTLNGDELVELLKADNKLKLKVNDWLKKSSLKSKLKIEVGQVQDIIHKLIVEQYGIKLDITDVGFGISQVLPILVQGFISQNNTLTMMEQPEVHLHPKMQADLADLFIKIIKTSKGRKKQRCLLIETHSEYILNRLRRRIAEGNEVTNEDVAIYAIERIDNNAVINPLLIPQKGNFKYPEDFYDGELFKDTMIFLKAQND